VLDVLLWALDVLLWALDVLLWALDVLLWNLNPWGLPNRITLTPSELSFGGRAGKDHREDEAEK
jgi:hypothetical protein